MTFTTELKKEELEFYSRQILSFKRAGQLRLKNSRVIIIGAGGIGSSLLPILVSSGVGEVIFFEDDHIERSNLSRQLLYTEQDIGKLKGEVALKKLRLQNPYVKINWCSFKLDSTSFKKDIFKNIDLIIDATDCIKTKLLTNQFSSQNKISSIIASLDNEQAHIILQNHQVSFDNSIGCYECLFGELLENLDDVPTCANSGVISTNPFLLGSYVAQQAIYYLLDNQQLQTRLILFENFIFRICMLAKRHNCNNCS